MTEVTKYVCDYCGEEFEDEEDCIAHEMRELKGSVINDIHIADKDGNPLALDEEGLDKMRYASILTLDAAKVMDQLLNEAGYETIYRYTHESIGQFYYDTELEEWISFKSLESKYRKLAEIFEQMK